MNLTVHIAMLGWPIITLVAFVFLPARRAVLFGVFGGWLFLPEKVGYGFIGLPDYDRYVATMLGAMLGAVIFDPMRLLALRPKWFDGFIVVYCAAPMFSSLSNGLGAYDGLSAVLSELFRYGFAYVLGRAYLCDREGMRDLLYAVLIAGLIYTPLILFESRMSPQLHRWVYGYHPNKFLKTLRWGGYRPWVFLAQGIELGVLMGGVVIAAFFAWRSRATRGIWFLPIGLVLAILALGLLVSRAANAWGLVILLVGLGYLMARLRLRALPILLVLVPILYIGYRVEVGIPRAIPRAIGKVSYDRARSMASRFAIEHVFVAHAMKRPLFGWGTHMRNRPDVKREDMPEGAMGTSATDSLWIIVVGQKGLVGLCSLGALFLLPLVLLTWKVPMALWLHPLVGGATGMALLTYSVMINALYTAFIGPFYFLIIGGTVMYIAALGQQLRAQRAAPAGAQIAAQARARAARPAPPHGTPVQVRRPAP